MYEDTVSLVLLISPLLLLHVTSTAFVEVTVSFDVSVTGEVSTLHRTEVYGPEDVAIVFSCGSMVVLGVESVKYDLSRRCGPM